MSTHCHRMQYNSAKQGRAGRHGHRVRRRAQLAHVDELFQRAHGDEAVHGDFPFLANAVGAVLCARAVCHFKGLSVKGHTMTVYNLWQACTQDCQSGMLHPPTWSANMNYQEAECACAKA